MSKQDYKQLFNALNCDLKQKGGSVASDNVIMSTNNNTFNIMNANSTNAFSGGGDDCSSTVHTNTYSLYPHGLPQQALTSPAGIYGAPAAHMAQPLSPNLVSDSIDWYK